MNKRKTSSPVPFSFEEKGGMETAYSMKPSPLGRGRAERGEGLLP